MLMINSVLFFFFALYDFLTSLSMYTQIPRPARADIFCLDLVPGKQELFCLTIQSTVERIEGLQFKLTQ